MKTMPLYEAIAEAERALAALQELTRGRHLTAEQRHNMTESLKVPQLTFTDDVRCEEMMLARKRAKARQGAEKGSASIMALIIKATSMALKQYPIMNCSVLCPDCLEIVYNHDHNIGK